MALNYHHAGEVDLMVDQIQNLAQDALNLMGTVSDVMETAMDAMCISLGTLASACSLPCGAVIAGSCLAAGEIATGTVGAVVDFASDKLREIQDSAETPEISASSGNSPSSTDTDDVGDDGGYR